MCVVRVHAATFLLLLFILDISVQTNILIKARRGRGDSQSLRCIKNLRKKKKQERKAIAQERT